MTDLETRLMSTIERHSRSGYGVPSKFVLNTETYRLAYYLAADAPFGNSMWQRVYRGDIWIRFVGVAVSVDHDQGPAVKVVSKLGVEEFL